ncbi:MAG TPA: hypothetical protein VEP68_08830 [Anaeromyxobacteraceae bacterium]|nr:hypothetical protein [Anaeromyxobacteraceae bacterium]
MPPGLPGERTIASLAAIAVLAALHLAAEPPPAGQGQAAPPTAGVSADIGFPGRIGEAAAGGAGPQEPLPDTAPEPGGAYVAPRLDFPDWLGEVTGWWRPAPPGKAGQDRFHVTLAPFVTSSPLIGVGGGIAAAGTFQFGEAETTRLSKFSTNVLVTSEHQFSVPLRTNVTLPGGDWNLVGLWRWSKFPSPTWGLGGNTPESARSVVDYQLIRFHELVNRRLWGDLYAGLGYSLDYYFDIKNTDVPPGVVTDFAKYPWGTGQHSTSSGLCLNLLFDDRDSPIYATRGWYGTLSYTFNPHFLGSETTWQTVYLDVRHYLPLPGQVVVALWAYGWFNFGEVPYLMLASIGSDPDARSGRGFTEGRHIGQSLVYGEAELRYRIWEWLGGVAAVNVHSASEPDAQGVLHDTPRFVYVKTAVVAGLRILVTRETRSAVTLDVAFGRDAEWGIYLNFGEAF